MNLEVHKVRNIPDTCYYIPNFIDESEEKLLLHEINKTPTTRWTQLSHRRLINIGGFPTSKGMIAEEIPKYLQKYIDKINDLKVCEPLVNHILLNEYKSGQGILSHFDGPMFYPTIFTLSIGSHTVLEFNKPQDAHDENSFKVLTEFKLLIAPRSLVIIKDDLYTSYMHSISEINEDDLTDPLLKNLDKNVPSSSKTLERKTRYSLTIRNVPNTTKFKLKFFK